MSRKFSLAALVAVGAFALACTGTDRSPTGAGRAGPHLDLSAPPLAQIQDQIDKLFPSGGLRTAASAHLSNITSDLDKGKTDNARKKAFALVNFLRQKQGGGQLLDPNGVGVAPTTGEAADALVSSLYLYVGLTPAGTPPTNVAVDAAIAVVGPSGGTVVTGGDTPNGAVVFPAGALAQYVTVTIERLPNPNGDNYSVIPYRKYPIAFDIKTVPAVTLPEAQKATVAVCTIEPGTEQSGVPPKPNRLRLAHITATVPAGYELLPPGTSAEPLPSTCDDARLAAADPRPDGGLRLALWKARRIGDRALDALAPATAYAGHGGLLGQTTTFSPFVPADPDAPTSVQVTPAEATILQGGTQTLAASAYNSAGADVTEGSLAATWSSSSPAVASVSATGIVTGNAAGVAIITATIEGVAGSATVTVTARATGPVLYGVNSNDDGLSTIDPATGASTFVGTLGANSEEFTTPVSLAARPSDGALFAWNNSGANGSAMVLASVNRCTGRATPIGLSPDLISGAIAFGPDGTLYLATSELWTVSTTTGQAARVSQTGANLMSDFIQLGGMAFSPAGVLYGLELASTDGPRLITINPATGVGTLVTRLPGTTGVVGDMTFTPDGTLLVSVLGSSLTQTPNANLLFDLDPATGTISNIRQVSGGTAPQGLAFSARCSG